MVSDDEGSDTGASAPFNTTSVQEEWLSSVGNDEAAYPTSTAFDLDGPTSEGEIPPNIIDDEEDRQPSNLVAEFLRYHQKFESHMFKKLICISLSSIINMRYSNKTRKLQSVRCQFVPSTVLLFSKGKNYSPEVFLFTLE
jgi:hypothetical protein